MKNEGSVKKNALLNVLRQVCTIVFPFLTFSYASHVLGAGKTGIYTFGQSIVSYFSYLAMLGIPDYAVREIAAVRRDAAKSGKLANELFTIQLLSSFLSYMGLLLLLGIWERLDAYWHVIGIQSVQIALAAIGADWVNTAFEDFKYLTVRYFVTALACTAAIFWFVKEPGDLYWYTFFSMFCTAGGNVWNVFYIRRYVKLRPTVHLDFKRHLPPLLLLFFNNIALVIYLNSDITLLGIFMGDAAVGIYSVSAKIYMMAKSIVNAVIMAAVPRLSQIAAECRKEDREECRRRDRKEEMGRMLSGMADLLCLILVPVATGIFFEAENIIYFVAGSEYLGGTQALRICSITIAFAVGACFFSYAVLVPLHMEKRFLMSTILAAGLNIGLNFWLIPCLGINGAAFTTLLAEVTVAVLTFYFVKKAAGMEFQIHKRDAGIDLAGGVAIGMVCLMIRQLGLSRLLELGVSVVLAGTAYGSVLLVMKNQTFLALLEPMWKRKE